jgi:hypothetical protein
MFECCMGEPDGRLYMLFLHSVGLIDIVFGLGTIPSTMCDGNKTSSSLFAFTVACALPYYHIF